MRRSQTVKHHMARPSLALAADDLGMLREGDETNEDVLRKQLLERDRECERLQNMNLALKEELKQRPPLDDFQSFQREKKSLELILQGTQRENERSLNEINRLKDRCNMLERELTRLLGENWQSTLEISPITSGRTHQRSNTIAGSPLASSFHHSSSAGRGSPRPSSAKGPDSRSPTPAQADPQDKLAALARVEELRMLILGMEQRFNTREEKVDKLVGQAAKESERCDRLAARLVEA